ncbi:MAG: phosphotransferase [Rhodospirillaceae bacterium]|nr:phosphotransferase [Rhodospirillaceae bacterium]
MEQAVAPGGTLPPEIAEALRRIGLLDGAPRAAAPLAGGVSSDIWRIELPDGRAVCVKRALPRLRVAGDWRAPVERSRYEARWIRTAGAIVPDAVPQLIGEDEESGLFVMAYLDPRSHRWWKGELLEGAVRAEDAAAVAAVLVRIHAATAGDPVVPARFPTDAIFHAIRLEPYLEATAVRHPDLGPALLALSRDTAACKRALVHGDVSPKNILLGPKGPVLLDAECAWFGDPAFDIAFCLNHLLLKCLARPAMRDRLLDAFGRFVERYAAGVGWEPWAGLQARVARLLPALLLARIDGKSPVEYVTAAAAQEAVRRIAKPLIAAPPPRLADVAAAWAEGLDRV